MKDQRDSCRIEALSDALKAARERFGQLAIHLRGVDAGLFEHRAVFQDARLATPAALALPPVLDEARAAVQALNRRADLPLERSHEGGHSRLERLQIRHRLS